MAKLLLVIGGPNGCGKTSVYEALRSRKGALPFFNADMIAVATQGKSGSVGEIQSGKLMLEQLRGALAKDQSVSFETTLSGKLWAQIIKDAQSQGYRVIVAFVSLRNTELSIKRIATRVAAGGHQIPEATVRRRWPRSHRNFFTLYKNLCDSWYIFDNSSKGAILVAEGADESQKISNQELFSIIESHGKQ